MYFRLTIVLQPLLWKASLKLPAIPDHTTLYRFLWRVGEGAPGEGPV